MAAENSRFRSRLFKSLRAGVVLNCICSCLFVCAILFHRSSISSLRSSLDSERLRNADLVTRLNIALKAITNDVFAAAGAFVQSYSTNLYLLSSPAPSRFPGFAGVSNVVDELPPISFSGFFEVDGCPYIRVRNKYFGEGDLLLGHPVQLISPDVVKYRNKFYKVELEIKP